MRKILLGFLAALALGAASPASAQYAQYNPAVWFSGGAGYYAAWDGPGNYCCGRIFTINQIYGNIGPIWYGAVNALGDPLQFGTRYTNWARSGGLEFVNTNSGNTPAHITKFFASDSSASFNYTSCWAGGCPGNNMVIEFCCVPNNGQPIAEVVTYNTYNPETSTDIVTMPGQQYILYPFVVWKGGQGQPFVPDFSDGGSFYQGIQSPVEAQFAPSPTVGNFNGGSDFLYWTQWDTGVADHATISQGGNTSTYPFNTESGAQWAPFSFLNYLPPDDYTMGPE